MTTAQLTDAGQISARIQANLEDVERHAALAEECLNRGELATASAYCSVAAQIAIQNHAGIFWSPQIESILNRIGRAIPAGSPLPAQTGEIKRVLHVVTQMRSVGGHTKLLALWAKSDTARENALVLTQHRGSIPSFVNDVFGDRLYRLNTSPGGHIAWAKQLRKLAAGYDAVVLHTHGDDVVATIAFAEPGRHPPVILLNHADHLFWLGSSVCHLVINLRDAAHDLTIDRRGVATERNVIVPTLIEPIHRARTREQAKCEIGVSPDTTLIVSVARKVKYRSVNGVTFADMHAPVLQKFPNAQLLVVGAGDPEDWAPARAATNGRISGLPEQNDPKVYFEAGDIYVDSFPFVSSTSMMEAACYGLPLLTLFTGEPEGRILAINHVGLVGTALTATSYTDYQEQLRRLLADPELRNNAASAAQSRVSTDHQMPRWQDWLNAAYDRALSLPVLDNREMLSRVEKPGFGEPDSKIENIFGGDYPHEKMLAAYVGILPARQRITYWNKLRRAGALPGGLAALSLLAPDWIRRRIKDEMLKA